MPKAKGEEGVLVAEIAKRIQIPENVQSTKNLNRTSDNMIVKTGKIARTALRNKTKKSDHTPQITKENTGLNQIIIVIEIITRTIIVIAIVTAHITIENMITTATNTIITKNITKIIITENMILAMSITCTINTAEHIDHFTISHLFSGMNVATIITTMVTFANTIQTLVTW